MSTAAGNVTIGGLVNGVSGQAIHITKINWTNDMTIEHNAAAGTQKIFTPDSLDMIFSGRGGATLVCPSGNTWYVVK